MEEIGIEDAWKEKVSFEDSRNMPIEHIVGLRNYCMCKEFLVPSTFCEEVLPTFHSRPRGGNLQTKKIHQDNSNLVALNQRDAGR